MDTINRTKHHILTYSTYVQSNSWTESNNAFTYVKTSRNSYWIEQSPYPTNQQFFQNSFFLYFTNDDTYWKSGHCQNSQPTKTSCIIVTQVCGFIHQSYILHSYEYEQIVLLAKYFCTHISENIIVKSMENSALKWQYLVP